jgi:8-hydroxy-5-deazaflavin:NADPH oxidoreductase
LTNLHWLTIFDLDVTEIDTGRVENHMRIGIIGGTGKQGRALAKRLSLVGHSISLGSRDPKRAEKAANKLSKITGTQIAGLSNSVAGTNQDLVVLSIPYSAHRQTLLDLRDLLGETVLLDMTVPLRPPAVDRVHLPRGQAAALETQAILGDSARVVAGVHHISAAHLSDPSYRGHDLLLASDDKEAMEMLISICTEIGFRGLDAGGLCNAVALEAMTPVLIHLNRRYGSRAGSGLAITGLPKPDPT